MYSEQFKKDLSELYQGEILGEVLFDQMLSYFQSPDKQYKLSLLLQLETETKARLRPTLVLLGIDLVEWSSIVPSRSINTYFLCIFNQFKYFFIFHFS